MVRVIFDDHDSSCDNIYALHSKLLYLALWGIQEQVIRFRRGKELLDVSQDALNSEFYEEIVGSICDKIFGIIKDSTVVNLMDLPGS